MQKTRHHLELLAPAKNANLDRSQLATGPNLSFSKMIFVPVFGDQIRDIKSRSGLLSTNDFENKFHRMGSFVQIVLDSENRF